MKQPELELNERVPTIANESEIKQRGLLSQRSLKAENRNFKGTRGISQNNQRSGFVPAFQNKITGRCVISRFADGSPAPIHVLDGLPLAWIRSHDKEGHVTSTRKGIIAGFIRGKRFYTREEAALCA